MKKALVILVVLGLCVPAMAATVSIVDNGDTTGTITVTAEGAENIVGLALDIDVTSGGDITGAVVDTATFNIHMDAAHDMEEGVPGSYNYGDGTAIANQDAVGEASVSGSFAISVGALNGETTAGATGSASVSITVTFDGHTCFEIKENALRGGIILTDGTGENITNGTAGVVDACNIEPPWGFTRYYAEGTPQHDLWVSLGSPDCWCSDIHQCGDVNGDCFVTIADDIMPMVIARAGAYDPCADANYDGFVTIADDIMTAVRHRDPATPPHTNNGGDCLDGTCPTAVGQETDGVCDPQSDGDGEWIMDGNDD